MREKMSTLATETQFHVLAVDDSIIDRKLIERLLKTSSYQGELHELNILIFLINLLILANFFFYN